MIDLREVCPVTELQRNIKDCVGRLKENKTPFVLSVSTCWTSSSSRPNR